MAIMLEGVGAGIERYMNLVSARQKLVASNIANADTPGYQTKDIDFQSELENQIAGSKPDVVEVSGLKTKNDGNNVDMDREARLLAENDLAIRVACNLAQSELQHLKIAIEEGKSVMSLFSSLFGQRVGDVGAAHPRRAAGGKSRERRNHAHARRRTLPPQRCRLCRRQLRSDRSPRSSTRRSARKCSGRYGQRDHHRRSRPRQRATCPGHPDADKDGYVAFPKINPAEDMVDLMGASRGYEANVAAISAVKDMIQKSLDLFR